MGHVIGLHHFGATAYVLLSNFHVPYEDREPYIWHAACCSLCSQNFNGYLHEYGLTHSNTPTRAVFLEGLLITVQHNPTVPGPWLLACPDLDIWADADTQLDAIVAFSRQIIARSKQPVENHSLAVNQPRSAWRNNTPMERYRAARATALGLATRFRNEPHQFQVAA